MVTATELKEYVHEHFNFSRYDNPKLAEEIVAEFVIDGTIPSNLMIAQVSHFSKAENLRKRLKSLDLLCAPSRELEEFQHCGALELENVRSGYFVGTEEELKKASNIRIS